MIIQELIEKKKQAVLESTAEGEKGGSYIGKDLLSVVGEPS